MDKQGSLEQVAPQANVMRGVRVTNQYIGPLPSPEDMQGFGNIDTSFPERIMQEFEKNSEHTRQQEQIALQAQITETRRGQYMAFFVILGGFIGTMALAYSGKNAASIAVGLGTAVMVFKGVFQKK